ncbi:MAG: hypothetical protein K0S68_840 [Candidatus Saccharibacteria bacterium]|nr:hypothetical protein [Candidatus Saccharibacteria bacterium]
MQDYSTNPALFNESAANTFFSPVFFLVGAVFIVLIFVALWKIFTKAGQPGWAALIPIYNTYVLLTIVGRPAWWLVAMIVLGFIPVLNLLTLVFAVILSIDLAKSFGKSPVFGIVALLIFSVVGYFILAFGPAKYTGPSVKASVPAKPAPSA